MNWLTRLLWTLITARIKRQIKNEAKRRAVIAYLRAINVVRHLLMVLVAVWIVGQMMVLSLAGLIITGAHLWIADTQLRLEILFWTFGALFALPFLAILIGLSGRLWYNASGARRMVDEISAAD